MPPIWLWWKAAQRQCRSPRVWREQIPLRFMLVVLALVGAVAAGDATLSLLDVHRYPTARCMDGTPGGFYFRAASSTDAATKWVVSLEGGGECVTEAACKSRLSSSLGSSKYFAPAMDLGQLQSIDESINPDLFAYNQVFVKYCSSDVHTGTMARPSAATWGLQFSGFNIVQAVLGTLAAQHNLNHSTVVVWSGDSAGGIGCIATVDAVHDLLPGAKIVGAPIGGFYFSNDAPYNGTAPPPISFIPWTYADLQTYTALWQSFFPVRCAAARSSAPWTCLFAAASYSTIVSPMFITEAQTDEVVMPLHDGLPDLWDSASHPQCHNTVVNCPPAVVAYMGQWRAQMETALVGQIKQTDGVFHPACLIHTNFGWAGPLISGINFIQAFGDWLFHRSSAPVHLVDSCGIMCNLSCNQTYQRP